MHRRRPEADASDAAWADYLYRRANPRGPHRERWVHTSGCGQWFALERDTVTHEILAASPLPDFAGTGVK